MSFLLARLRGGPLHALTIGIVSFVATTVLILGQPGTGLALTGLA